MPGTEAIWEISAKAALLPPMSRVMPTAALEGKPNRVPRMPRSK